MGMLKAAPRVDVRVVMTGPVSAKIGNGPRRKSIMWLLESKQLVLATAGAAGKTVVQTTHEVDHVIEDRNQTTVVLASGEIVLLDKLDCRCGMGVVGSARIVPERHRLVRVPAPDWVQPA